jgi:cytochrome bd ubiquinol oxidase subunit I
MEFINDSVVLSRIQFALTAMFHILWPLLWLKTKDRDYFVLARFWGKLFLLNFAIGVVSGIPMEFEFGTNWAPFSQLTGEFFGNVLGYDGAMALMLEAGFLGIMMFGWNRVTAGMHLFATIMVALGSSLSALLIMIANGWMQNPTGGHIEGDRYVVDSYVEALLNPNHYWGYSHMWLACMATTLFVVAGVSAWHLLKQLHDYLFRKCFKLALIGLVLVTPLQILVGDIAGVHLFHIQPAKAAAIEAHWETNPPGQGAEWHVLAWPNKVMQANDWTLSVPNVLSILATHKMDGQVNWVVSVPLGYLATECGWIVREVGRQPWAVYGLLRTEHAASHLPAPAVVTSLILFAVIYSLLLLTFILFARRIILTGPNIDEPLPALRLPIITHHA